MNPRWRLDKPFVTSSRPTGKGPIINARRRVSRIPDQWYFNETNTIPLLSLHEGRRTLLQLSKLVLTLRTIPPKQQHGPVAASELPTDIDL